MLKRTVKAMILQKYGHPTALLKAIDQMEDEALKQLLHIFRQFEDDIRRAERTFRPFPGGPRIRL